jgi:hypothetical protein
MSQNAISTSKNRYARYTAKSCPKCRSNLHRVWRRPVDRLISFFVPVHRFRCQQFVCQWTGNLRVAGTSVSNSLPPETDDPFTNPVRASASRTFIGSMLLLVAGIATIILVPVMDLMHKDPQAYLEPSSHELSAAPKLDRVSAQPQRDAGPGRVEASKYAPAAAEPARRIR